MPSGRLLRLPAARSAIACDSVDDEADRQVWATTLRLLDRGSVWPRTMRPIWSWPPDSSFRWRHWMRRSHAPPSAQLRIALFAPLRFPAPAKPPPRCGPPIRKPASPSD